ncbi:ABC transporter substrate-binding protein [Anatilimnocola sp. NA78]|uniref:ABC transporter substrate-binding protein n=1 Tax=Anatilimnocola sp. NA78 TaxID=3415683 RepID=UPI003CE5B5CB
MNHTLILSRVAILLFVLLTAAAAIAAEPLYLQAPYDEVKLDETNGNTLLKVKSLNLPERKVPPPANRRGDLELELLERPGETFAVPWLNVVDVKLFEERVLAEVEQQVAAGKHDEAQAGYRYLEQKHPQLPGLSESIERFLWIQIGGSFRAGKHDETLALLVELYRRNPKRPGLSTAFERTTSELVKARIAAGNFRGARGLLTALVKRFPELAATTSAPFQLQMQEQAQQLLTQAQAAAAANRWSEAHQFCSQALEVWPQVAGGSELSQQIHGRYPVVVVGVIGSPAPLPAGATTAISNWHLRRTNQLLATPLAELIDSEKGPTYRSQFGTIVQQADDRQLIIRLAEPTAGTKFTAADLARKFKPAGESATFISALRARNAQDLLIEFTHPQLRPAAWLTSSFTLSAGETDAHSPSQYKRAAPTSLINTFQLNPSVAAASTAPQIIQEKIFADSIPALLALRRGQISVVDRIPPWDVQRYRAVSGIKVLPYAIPTVHLLVPNGNRPLMSNRAFRRALLYAIDRESILKQGLLADQQLAGCEVLSGPFPQGPDREPWSYAHNSQMKPRAYDPSLATMLLAVGRSEVGGDKSTAITPLVLAHDDQPTAKIACQSIARQLTRIGQPITLRQVAAGEAAADADLTYVELAIHEPIVDAWTLLGPNGLASPCSPLMLEHFRGLEAAADWPSATSRLQAIDRLAAAELPVIPLWQTTNFLAANQQVTGLANRPVTLYENVIRWQIAWQKPQD